MVNKIADCYHPKTARIFFKLRLFHHDRYAKLKRRGQTQIRSSVFSKIDDDENQNSNLSTPPNQQAKSLKVGVKSSSERKKPMMTDDISQPQMMRCGGLKLLFSRYLFAGRDILSHISEFCNELKKLATRAKEREIEEAEEAVVEKERKPLL
ncbi:uncharacterized protein LOC120160904 [Hibiscus syriacus]|uniref:uncharacterized protein LOC120160904 n=1 Tax=Hibiscus syriacus TaxID=106335 RepID=UPI0019248AD4|nr:uncharacterized protein LOC120160904 [Hibiscus syriacus]